jgi:predicted nucleic acid-binding protein
VSPQKALVVDACVAINLRASDTWPEVFDAGGWRPVMPSLALDEVLYVIDANGERQLIPLRSHADQGWFEVWEATPEEAELIAGLGAVLGPGEAACLAMAVVRDVALATDDRLARTRATTHRQTIELVSTPELVRAWARVTQASAERLSEILQRIEDRARFRPSPSGVLSEWWSTSRQN